MKKLTILILLSVIISSCNQTKSGKNQNEVNSPPVLFKEKGEDKLNG